MFRWHRVFAECAAADPMVLDLPLAGNGLIATRQTSSGWWGKPGTPNCLPFVLLPDGRGDFGGAFDEDTAEHTPDDERYGTFELPRLAVEVGRHFAYSDNTGRYEFVIKRVTDLQEL